MFGHSKQRLQHVSKLFPCLLADQQDCRIRQSSLSSQKGSFIKSWELQDDRGQWGDVPHLCHRAERLGDRLVCQEK
eukprot:1132981-Pelagomonas_calceolata.AAC.1